MSDESFRFMVIFVAFSVCALAVGGWWYQRQSDCDARGGVLVQDAWGWGYECVEGK